MELVDYVRVLRRRWLVVLLAALACAGIAYGLAARTTPRYEATTRLVVTAPGGSGTVDELSGRTLAVSRASAWSTYAGTGPAVDAALQGAGYAPGTARPTVLATADGETPFITVTVSDSDPQKAAAVANAYATELPDVVAQLDAAPAGTEGGLTVVDPAGVPSEPASPQPERDALIGLVLGLVLGVGIAFVREALDRTYKDADVLESQTGLPVLGVVPQELARVDLPTISHPTSSRAEAYRTVRTNIQFAGPDDRLKRIVITSATPAEGKTTVAANLAVAMARQGQSVVLVDADLRRPRVHRTFGVTDPGPGLAAVLRDGAPVAESVRQVEDDLFLIPAGRVIENPSELLGSPRMASLLTELSSSFDVVLVDTPPVLPVTDALVLSVGATAILVVVRLGETSRERLKRALGSFEKLGVPVLGLVANGSQKSGDAAYGYGKKYGYASRSRH